MIFEILNEIVSVDEKLSLKYQK